MSSLFAKKHKSRKRVRQEDAVAALVEESATATGSEQRQEQPPQQQQQQMLLRKRTVIVDEDVDTQQTARSFQELGLCSWLCDSCAAMGFRRPTPAQSTCIPAILAGKDV